MADGAAALAPGKQPRRRTFPAWLPWFTWGLGALLFCYGFFQRVAPSVMIDHLMRDLAVGGAVLGNLSAFYFYAYASLQIPVGLMVDRWGPRRLLTGGALLCGLGSLLFALAQDIALAYLGRLLIGAGAGFGFVSTLKLATSWFPPQRFAQISGFTLMLGMLGGIGGQAPLAVLVEVSGWRGTLFWAAAFAVLLAALIWLLVRDRPPDAPLEDGAETRGTALLAGLAAVARAPRNWILALVCAAMTAPMLAFAGLWGVAWLMQTKGLARPEAAGTASLMLLGWAIGGPLLGTLSDRLRRRKGPLLGGGALGLACLAAILYLPGLPLAVLWVLFLLNGIGLGAMVIGFAAAREGNPPSVIGVAYAFVNTAVVATGAVFQPLVGALLDLAWDGSLVEGARIYSPLAYRIALSSLVAFLALGLLAGLALEKRRPTTSGDAP
ncbi:MAG: MFS transporter [Rhodospirillales bacterium]|nr:MFS transporter [Rhodospirillales bacterium]